jgi:hypothetical protein
MTSKFGDLIDTSFNAASDSLRDFVRDITNDVIKPCCSRTNKTASNWLSLEDATPALLDLLWMEDLCNAFLINYQFN